MEKWVEEWMVSGMGEEWVERRMEEWVEYGG